MRWQRVFTNYRCNQNCSFCTYRRASDRAEVIAPAALRVQIAAAIAQGARGIVLTGGEPTMRRDLPSLVEYVTSSGAAAHLETNGTLVDVALAASLAGAGLALARVHFPIPSPDLDDLTHDPGGFAAAVAGLRALRDAGVKLEVSVTLVRSTARSIGELPGGLVALVGESISRIVVVVPTDSPDEREILSFAEATAAVIALENACRLHGIRLQLAEDSGPPPCAFPPRTRPHHLYALSRGGDRARGFRQLAECARCAVQDRCPGVAESYLSRHSDVSVTAITDDRARRRLSIVGTVDEQIAREVVQPSFAAHGPEEALVRVNFHCNQACDFCFVSTHLPAAADTVVRLAIEQAGSQGKRVILTGGEPTLNARLAEYVNLSRQVAGGRWPIELQTNAVLLDDERRVRTLVDAGLDRAFVSLHGSTAPISDAVTRAPGTYARTVVGIDHLVRAGVSVVINFVICTTNAPDLPAMVELVARRWPGASLNVSFVAPSTDLVPRESWLIPRYSDALPRLEQALARASELAVSVVGFESMCGMPMCLVPARIAEFADVRAIGSGADQGEFVRTEECRTCDLSRQCWGLRRGYAEIHGTDEIRAVRVETASA